MNLSEQMARVYSQLTYEDLPEEVIAFTKLCLLDYFGSALAGISKAPIQMISEAVAELGGNPQATLVTGGKSSVLNAALVNGASSHVVELDDIHKSSIIHAATVVIPAALAVAEWKELSGEDLILAIVLGYEFSFRIGEAVSPSHYHYWHNTATCGTFGSAVAAAKLLNLDEEAFINALGNAGSQAAGLWEFIEDGAMTKQLHTGKAAMNGLMASLLAEKRFTGAKKILEGNRGFFNAMSDVHDAGKITRNLGNEFKILENSFKVHASCRHTHAVIDLAIEIANENHVDLEDIDHIDIGGYQATLDITDNDDPKTEYASKFSVQYCTALAIVKRSAGLDDFGGENLWDTTIREVMDKVHVELDPEINAAYPKEWGAKVTVVLKSGKTISKQTDFPKGDPENPVTEDDVRIKFMKLAMSLPEENRQVFADRVLEVESIDNIADLMAELNTNVQYI